MTDADHPVDVNFLLESLKPVIAGWRMDCIANMRMVE